ncbi:hypothetical protein [Arenimonas sp.]|uniref:hypothetical protein n=1 Tax=Arenimonas sp. TaxID=1872635 RepID=UPI0025B8D913|nr:hypothetical protein [Arenimonas sp.]
MTAQIESIERVAVTEPHRRAVRERSAGIAHVDHGSPGGLLGFDFHRGPDGPWLFEINTHPGGVPRSGRGGAAGLPVRRAATYKGPMRTPPGSP